MRLTAVEHTLYLYAISCALSALVNYAGQYGRGWYHFADGAVIIATEISL
jgi:hypothetical protein